MSGAERLRALLAAALLAAGAPPAAADTVEVDLELALMVDVSRSMTPGELEIQRRGYAAALGSEAVERAISGGLLGRIAVTYVEWAGRYNQRVVVDWTLIESREDARAVARRLTADFSPSMRRTSIAGALLFAAESIETNVYEGLRRVIDVSGDGPNNEGRPVWMARDSVLERRITVNGLPLMTREGAGSRWHLEDLDAYYRACVIGGPGAFVIPVTDWTEFEEAVRRKLVLEIAGRMSPPRIAPPPEVIPAQTAPPADYDCLVGEKIWERYFRDGLP